MLLEEPRPRRQMRPEITARRAALTVLRPLGNKIYAWNIRTAWLIAMADKMSKGAPRRATLLQEIELRLEEVRAARLDFAKKVATLPSAAATSTRVIDADRALASIATGLERTLLVDNGVADDDGSALEAISSVVSGGPPRPSQV